MGTQMIPQGIAPQPGAALFSNVAYIPPGLEGLYKEPFTYNVLFNPIAAGAVVTGTTNIQNDSYFVATTALATIFDSATGRVNTNPAIAPMYVRLADSSSGKYKMDQATPIAALFGTAEQPKVWLYRANIWMPGGQIQAELTNKMAADQIVYLSFDGFKVYNVPDQLTA